MRQGLWILVVTALILMVASGAFAGGKKENAASQPAAKTEPAGTTQPAAATQAIDLGGRTVTIAYVDIEGMQNYFKDGDGRGRIELVEKKLNCKIAFAGYEWDGRDNVIIKSVLAGSPLGDIIIITNRSIPTLASNGAIRAMDDILDEAYYQSLPGSHKNMRALYSSFKGKAYAASVNGSFQRNVDIGSSQGWFYNRDMFKAAGLETPNELVKRNAWTWDAMREAAKKLTKDTNGDGEIDVWGVGARLDTWPIDQEMAVYANGGGIVKYKNGKYTFALNEPDALAAMQMWRDIVNIDKTIMIGDKYDLRAEFVKGTVAMFRNDLFAVPDDAKNITFDYGWVWFPKGPNAKDYVNPVWGMDVATFPVGVKDPKAMVEIVNELFEITSKQRDLSKYEEDFASFFMQQVKDRDSLDAIKQFLNKAKLWDFIPADIPDDPIRFAMVDAVMKTDKSPKAIMDAIAPKVQAVIDETMNK